MIYADSSIIMRWVDGTTQVREPIDFRWKQILPSDRIFVTSRIARLECLCKPLREGRNDLLHLYETFFAGKEVIIREINAAVVEKATELRASFGLKTPDAIHAATAMLAGVKSFWTTDSHFSKCPGLNVEMFGAV
jgi:predicted nucleic acid-binding protein